MSDYYLCPLNGLRKGDTIVIEAELISDYRAVEVLSTQYLSDNSTVRVVYQDDGEQKVLDKNEWDAVFLRRPEMHVL